MLSLFTVVIHLLHRSQSNAEQKEKVIPFHNNKTIILEIQRKKEKEEENNPLLKAKSN